MTNRRPVPAPILRAVLRLRGWRLLAGVAVILAYVALLPPLDTPQAPAAPLPAAGGQDTPAVPAITCDSPRIIDGDTFDCGGVRIRLQGIDAPEMPGHCRPGRQCTPGNPFAAQQTLVQLTRGPVACQRTATDVYGRTVARCTSGGQDLSCAMLAAHRAVHRYGAIDCGN